jgi:integral membrane sensor domain MASE1
MTNSRFFRNLITVAGLCAVYFVAGKLGLMMAVVHPSATAVWPPTGIALAALLLLGYRVWPGILLGAFLVNVATAGTVATSLGIAAGNTLEGLLGAYLVNRFAGGCNTFNRAQDIFKFTVLAGMACTVSATFGVTSLSLGGFGVRSCGDTYLDPLEYEPSCAVEPGPDL